MGVGKIVRFVVSIVVLLAIASPVIRDHDSFPLSMQPMFAAAREPTDSLSSAVGLNPDGTIERLSLRVIARTDDPLIAQSFVRDAITAGRAVDICNDIAVRVLSDASFAHITEIVIVTETLDLINFVVNDVSASTVDRHATCQVQR